MAHPSKIGKYEIEGVIGEGGMGVVYRGRDPLIDRVVAIKTIRTEDKADHEELLQRLRMEARSAGKLQHPNIVVIHDFGEQDDLTFLVMEYVEGRNLARIIKSGKGLPFSTRLDVIVQLCQGLDYAHGLGVTHRDIKPGNIAITARGTAKILDFGLARVGAERLTKTGFTSGTIAYMSPERMRGQSGASDDIFALGAVAYEILTYQRAFPGTTYSDVVTKVLSDQYPKPPSSVAKLPPELDPIILKALARDPKERYQTTGELAKEIDAFRTTLTYQNFVAQGDQGDSDALSEEAPISSNANPYSAGSMTPTPASESSFDTRQAQSAPLGPDDRTMETHIGGLAHGGTSQESAAEPPTAQSIVVPSSDLDLTFEQQRTEIAPVRDLAGPAPDAQDKTVQAPPLRSGAAPASRPAKDEPAPSRPAPADAGDPPTGKTAVMSRLRRFMGREEEPDPQDATIVDERRGSLRAPASSPASAPVATAPTAVYAPGAKPAPETPRGPGTTAKAPSTAAGTPSATQPATRVRAGGLTGTWLPIGVTGLCVVAASLLAHIGGVGVYLALFLASVLGWIWLLRTSRLLSLKQALTVGLLLRVALVFIPPVIATEAYRGLFDGRMVANGLNPYVVAPVAEEVAFQRPGWFPMLASPGEASTTPPWALLMFMVVAWVGGGLFFWKLLLLGIEMMTIRLLARERTGHAMMLYATCPIVMLEGLWIGRAEVVVIALLVAASWATRQRGEIKGGLLTGIGMGTSFLALPALPALWGTAERMVRMIAATLAAAVIPLVIFATQGRLAERLREMLFGPEISGFVLVWLTDRISQARIAESIAARGDQIAWQPLANFIGGISAADLAASFVAAIFLIVLIFVTKRSGGPDAAVANCLGVFFLVTALFVPAAWILLVPFAIAARQPLWLLYAIVTPLAYLLPDDGTSWMLLATLYVLPPIIWLVFRDNDGKVHLFDSAAGAPVLDEPKFEK